MNHTSVSTNHDPSTSREERDREIPDAIEPSEKIDLLKQSIERNEVELRSAMNELKTTMQGSFTVRKQLGDHPIAVLIGGFAIGYWFGRRG